MGQGDGTNRLIDIQNLYSDNWSSSHKVTSLGSIDGVVGKAEKRITFADLGGGSLSRL